MVISASEVKELRERTGAGVMDCKRALDQSGGNMAKAEQLLKEWGAASAEKRAHRETSQGLIECYIHAGGRVGAMIEVNCETDFVARTDDFKALAHDLAMQVVAMAPVAVDQEDLPPEAEGTPEELCLLRQPFVKDPARTIGERVREVIAKTGENIRVRRFARFELGQ